MALVPSTWSALTCCPGATAMRDTLQAPANSAGVWASVDIHSTKVLSTSSTSTLTSHTKLCIILTPLPSHATTGQEATAAEGQEVLTACHLTPRPMWLLGGRGHSATPHKQPASGRGRARPPGPVGRVSRAAAPLARPGPLGPPPRGDCPPAAWVPQAGLPRCPRWRA